jgi:hypothetical protein
MGHRPISGSYYDPIPVDFLILAKLPDAGMIGGVHWKGRLVRDIWDEIVKNDLNGDRALVASSTVTARLRSMESANLVGSYRANKGGYRIWARTAQGTEHLSNRDEILGIAPIQNQDQENGDGSV